jgi:hypothetical protein
MDIPIDTKLVALEARLRNLQLETPERDVATIMRRKPRRPPWLSRTRMGAALAVAACLMAAVGYVAPVTDHAAAAAPFVGDSIGHGMHWMGWSSVSGQVTQLDSIAESNGIRLHLIGGYTEKNVIVLIVRAEGGSNAFPGLASIKDQFLRKTDVGSGIGDGQTGTDVLTFPSLGWPDDTIGARLELTVSDVTLPGGQTVWGHWVMNGTVLASERRGLPAPPAVTTADGITVRYSDFGLSPSLLSTGVRITTPHALAREALPSPANTVWIDLIGPDGRHVEELTSVGGRGASPVYEETVFWAAPPRGRYVLRVRLGAQVVSNATIVIP